MPLLRIVTSANVPEGRAAPLLAALSKLVAERLGKPEAYVMTCLDARAAMTFAGTPAPACFVELASIGTFTPALTKTLSADLCARLGEALGVAVDRIYIAFADAKGYLWGHDGDTFG